MAEAQVANGHGRVEYPGGVSPRKIPTEAMVSMLVQRINEYRTDTERRDRVKAWSEALEALYDLVRPIAEGIPGFAQEWESRPVAVVTTPSGRRVPWPTASDCRAAQDVLFRALARTGMLYTVERLSGPGLTAKDDQEEP